MLDGSIALTDLVNRGLATRRENTENKRYKLIYTITDNGWDYLRKWLTLPVGKDGLRYETLLKLFFGNEQDTKQALSHIKTFEGKIKKELPYLLGQKKPQGYTSENENNWITSAVVAEGAVENKNEK